MGICQTFSFLRVDFLAVAPNSCVCCGGGVCGARGPRRANTAVLISPSSFTLGLGAPYGGGSCGGSGGDAVDGCPSHLIWAAGQSLKSAAPFDKCRYETASLNRGDAPAAYLLIGIL